MKKKLRLYLDTSVISALFDEKVPYRMSLTKEFWKSINEFDIFISEEVIAEIEETPEQGIREKMLQVVKKINILKLTEEAEWLSAEYVRYGAVPERYRRDALHIAIATVNNMDALLSWNYKHIVRRKTKRIVRVVNELNDLPLLDIITPPEILGG